MKNLFSIGSAAKIVNMTIETLRHYDRIGLVKPSFKNKDTKYRYYTKEDIVLLNTVHALQQMDLPLQEIKKILEYDDLECIIDILKKAETKADEKISSLKYSKSKIQLAIGDFEKKLANMQNNQTFFIKEYPKRIIMLSDTLKHPTLDNLWNYLKHFYDHIPIEKRDFYTFEDLAGIYSENGTSRLFATCIRYIDTPELKTLPSGKYLCVNCTEENRLTTLKRLLEEAKENYNVIPKFTIQQIVVSGILHWNYQIQILIEN